LGEILFLLGWLAFVAAYFISTASLPHEAKSFPYVILALMVLCIIVLLYRAVQKYLQERRAAPQEGAPQGKKAGVNHTLIVLAFIIVLSAVYVSLWKPIGFELSTVLYLLISMLVLKVKPLKAVIIAVAGMICLYIVFITLLKMNIPVLFWIG